MSISSKYYNFIFKTLIIRVFSQKHNIVGGAVRSHLGLAAIPWGNWNHKLKLYARKLSESPQNTDTHTVHIAISTLAYHINQNRTACTGSTALQAGLPLGPQYESGMPTGPSTRIWNALESSVWVWNAYRALSSYLKYSRVCWLPHGAVKSHPTPHNMSTCNR